MRSGGTRLKEINDQIYARWKAGENHVDLAHEYDRFPSSIESLVKNRWLKEEFLRENPDWKPGPSNKELGKRQAPRNEKIILGRAAGKTYAELAKEAGICRERVRQIWMRHLRRSHDPRGYGGRAAKRLSGVGRPIRREP